MSRLPDWQARLTAALMEKRHTPGNCAEFAADMCLAMTGVDHAAPFRGRYTTINGGYRVLRKAGYSDHVDFVQKNFVEKLVVDAVPGDIVVLDGDDGPTVGVVQGSAGCYVPSGRGMVGIVPISTVIRAFEV